MSDGGDGREPERCGREIDLPKDLSEIKDAMPDIAALTRGAYSARSMNREVCILHRPCGRLEQGEMLLNSAVPAAPTTSTSICSYVAL